MVLSDDGEEKGCWSCWKVVEVVERERSENGREEEWRYKCGQKEGCKDEGLIQSLVYNHSSAVRRLTAYFLLPHNRSMTRML